MTMANKHWIEVHHPGQFRPSLEDITDRRPEDLATIIRFFDDEGIPWAFGCGEEMPDQLPAEGRES
jgi:hypothetical protein